MWNFLARFFAKPRSQADPTSKAAIGKLGENEAERFLKAKNYRILARNWRSGKDEIDLICNDDEVLVFIEVRTRKTGSLVSGYASLTQRKRKALLRVCRAYLQQGKWSAHTPRFDVIEVEHLESEIIATRHYANVPLFSKSAQRGA